MRLSRRALLTYSGALAATLGLPVSAVAPALAAPLLPAEVPTTLRQTIRYGAVASRSYRRLVTAAGEPFLTRLDLLRRQPSTNRAKTRRSIAYLGHTSDIHIQDTQTPARLEPVNEFSPTLMPGTCRPQQSMSLFVQAQMVQALADVAFSPVSGAPMAAVVNTGDSSDQISNLETRWYIRLMDGFPVLADSGLTGAYEGVEVWPEATYAYHPDDPSGDIWGRYGFPASPGLMQAIVASTVTSPGLPAPWYSVFGNHDVLFNGFAGQSASLRALATGQTKYWSFPSWAAENLTGMAAEASWLQRGLDFTRQQFGLGSGFKRVSADPERRLLQGQDFISAHFENTGSGPGPVGHGWTEANLKQNTTYWSADLGAHLRLFGLDTCNRLTGADGAVPADQFAWLEAGLAECVAQNRLAIVLSHHNSLTLGNTAEAVFTPGQRLVHAEEFIAMLTRYPNLVAWLNGHTHANTIQAHPNAAGTGGFWEITTASCIDYPQQQQVLEICDNTDGTISIFTVAIDHASPAQARPGDFSQVGIASFSRELAANDHTATPVALVGSELDRNVELLLPAPFPMSVISDSQLERELLDRRAAVMKNTAKAGS